MGKNRRRKSSTAEQNAQGASLGRLGQLERPVRTDNHQRDNQRNGQRGGQSAQRASQATATPSRSSAPVSAVNGTAMATPSDGSLMALDALREVTILPDGGASAGSPAGASINLAFEMAPTPTLPPPVERASYEATGKTSGERATKSNARSSESSGMIEALAHALLTHDATYDAQQIRAPHETHETHEPMEEVSVTHPREPRDLAVGGSSARTPAYVTPVDAGDVFSDEAATDERPTVIITNDGASTLAEFALPGDPSNEPNGAAHSPKAEPAESMEAAGDPQTTNPTGHPTHTPGRMQRPARQLRASAGNPPPDLPAASEQGASATPEDDITPKVGLNVRLTPRIASDPPAPDVAPPLEAPAQPQPQAVEHAVYMPQPPQPAQPAHHIPQAAGAWPHPHAQGAHDYHAAGRPPERHGQPQAHYPHQGQQPPQQPQQQWAPPPPALMGAPLSPLAAPPAPAAGSPPLVAQAAPGAQKPSHAPWAVADSWGDSTFNGPNTAAGVSYLFGWVSGLVIYFGERQNRYVRFHAAQSILLTGALTILGVILFTMLELFGDVAVATHQPAYFHIGLGIALLGLAGMFIIWFAPMVAAWNGHYLRIPVIADYAERYAAPPREIYPDQ